MQQGKTWVLVQWPQTQGAMVALDPVHGDIRALVGGFDFYRKQFNHATQGWRQPGSSYKPFVYSGAIESGVQPDTLINDAPLDNVGNWFPENDDGSTDGLITLRSALARSKNLVSIRLVQLLSPQGARDWTSRFGFDIARQPDDLTQALGTGSTNPLQLAGAYAVLANGGLRVQPRLVQRITRSNGEVVFEAPSVLLDETQRAIPERNAFLVSSLLQEGTCMARPAPPTTWSTPGLPATNRAWWPWSGWDMTAPEAWAHAPRARPWPCRRGSSSWQPRSRTCRWPKCCHPTG